MIHDSTKKCDIFLSDDVRNEFDSIHREIARLKEAHFTQLDTTPNAAQNSETEILNAIHKSHLEQKMQQDMKEQEDRVHDFHTKKCPMVNAKSSEVQEKTGNYYCLHVIFKSFILSILMMNLVGRLCIPERIS